MRKIFCGLLATLTAVCCMCFAACTNDDETETDDTTSEQTQVCVLSELELNVSVDGSFDLQVLGNDLGLDVEWSSANVNIATVDEGKVVGIAPGKTNVTAKVGEQTLVCEVTVAFSYDNVVYITLANELEKDDTFRLQLLKGSTYTLTPMLMDGEEVDGVTFKVDSNSTAVTVQDKTLTAVSVVENAEVEISCSYKNQTYTLTVYVTVAE
ncbi:MAG: Ig-like domain-containing protein [Clostridia bacterium]|nr:Ig-like domain-containing protein [Clostridia bacterium]